MDIFTLVVVVVVVTPLLLSLIAFWVMLKEHRADWKLRRYNVRNRFNPDQNGNYPAFFDPASGVHAAFKPGNQSYQPQILMYNGVQKDIKPGRTEPEITVYGKPASSYPVTGQFYERADQDELVQPEPVQRQLPGGEPEQLPQLPNVQAERSVQEIMELLEASMREGEGKEASITRLTGAKKGSSKQWKYWSLAWDNLKGIEVE
jgi:hypothetical protein